MFAFWFVLSLWVAGALVMDGLPALRALETTSSMTVGRATNAQRRVHSSGSSSASIQQHLLEQQRQAAASTKAGDDFPADHRS